MDPKIKEQWVAALRSGKYNQGHNKLANAERTEHCCLGVLCELAVEAGVAKVEKVEPLPEDLEFVWSDSIAYRLVEDDRDGNSQTLPYGVARWAGLGDRVNPNVGRHSLATYNDGQTDEHCTEVPRHSFEQIADLIEEHL